MSPEPTLSWYSEAGAGRLIVRDADGQLVVRDGVTVLSIPASADDVLEMARRLENQVIGETAEGEEHAELAETEEAARARVIAAAQVFGDWLEEAGVDLDTLPTVETEWRTMQDEERECRGGPMRVTDVRPGRYVGGLDLTRPGTYLRISEVLTADPGGLVTLHAGPRHHRVYAPTDRVMTMHAAAVADAQMSLAEEAERTHERGL